MANLNFVPNKTTSELITQSNSNPKNGWVKIESKQRVITNGFGSFVTRTALVNANKEFLEDFIKDSQKRGIPGKITIVECVEDNIPARCEAVMGLKTRSFEDAVTKYQKKAGSGDDAQELTLEGKRILRFSFYDETGNEADVLVRHDNKVIGSYNNAAVNTNTAELPGA